MPEVDAHLIALHRLLHSQPRKLHRLLSEHGDAVDVFRNEPSLVLDSDLKHQSEADLKWLQQKTHHLICLEDEDYPPEMKMIFDPPPILYASGNRDALLLELAVAMVGARSATQYGMTQARHIAQRLAGHDVAVVSGLALGIDAASHEGALQGNGVTIAVLGSGCDQISPRINWRLAKKIQERGLILSELPLGSSPLARNFPRRNRIVTGMSRMTLVIEAAQRSGSLISARLAASEGKPVFAMPGLVTNKQAGGCHQLIKDGAELLESADDVLSALGLNDETSFTDLMTHKQLTHSQQEILRLLATEAMSLDQLIAEARIPAEEMMVELVTLEVLGLVVSESGNYGLDVAGINAL